MAKKNLASLMNGIMGSPASQEEMVDSTPNIQEPTEEQTSEVTEEMKESLEAIRYRNVGRPKKGTTGKKNEEIRSTFILNPEVVRKLKYISLVESSLLKDVINEALTGYIDSWEEENGKIRLPKKK